MIITRITPRKDGKFLVALHFNQGTNLRKIMSAEELTKTKEVIERDRQREIEYRQSLQAQS